MNSENTKKYLSILVVFGIVGCILIAFLRNRIEKNNRIVELVCDYDEVYEFSQEYGYDNRELLTELRLSGINSMAVNEETLRSLSASGDVLLFNSREMKLFASKYMVSSVAAGRRYTYILFEDKGLYEKVLLWLKIKFGEERIFTGDKTGYNTGGRYRLIAVDIRKKNLLKNVGLGFSGEKIKEITGLGMKVALRPVNDPYVSPLSIGNIFSSIEDMTQVSCVIFSGVEVKGYPDYVPDLERQLGKNDVKIGVVEFAKQKGMEHFKNNLIRVHSIKKDELMKKPVEALIYRFKRAVVERNIRLLYIHFVNEQARKGSMSEYVRGIRRAVEDRGFITGTAAVIPEFYPLTSILSGLIGLGLISFFMLMVTAYREVYFKKLLIIIVLFVLMAIAFNNNLVFLQLIALITAVLFPVFAVKRVFDENSDFNLNIFVEKDISELAVVLRMFFLVTLFSVIAALFITGLVSRWDFMMKLSQFRGIKAALLLPVVIGAFVVYPPGKHFGKFLSRNIRVGEAMAVLAAIIIFLVVLVRSGNYSSGMTGGFEYNIRELLERALYIRPRFKEFLIGHPFMLVGIYLWVEHLRGKGYMSLTSNYKPFIIIGMVGQVSIINSFCHIHTPLMVSVIRTVNGLWIGILFGLVLISLRKLIKW